jgi:hypothetical protein
MLWQCDASPTTQPQQIMDTKGAIARRIALFSQAL